MDQRQIWAYQLWQNFSSIEGSHKIDPRQFNRSIFLLMTMWLIRDGHDLRTRLSTELLRSIRALIMNFRDREAEDILTHFLDIESVLFQELNIPHPMPSTPLSGRQIRDVMEVLDKRFLAYGDTLYLADVAFYRSIARPRKVGLQAREAALDLAYEFLPVDLRIVDYFLETGDIGVRAAQRIGGNVQLRTQGITSDGPTLRLRLALHRVTILLADTQAYSRRWQDAVLLLSHPMNKPSSNDVDRGMDESDGHSALQALRQMDAVGFKLAVVAVPARDTTASGWLQDFRHYLVETGRLLAVVAGTSNTRKTAIDQDAIWLVTSEPRQDAKVLFIDVGALAREKDADLPELMRFVAELVCLLPGTGKLRDFPYEGGSGRYRGQFSREFRSGYRDVRGLCKLVSSHQIQKKNWTLAPSVYVGRAPADKWWARQDSHVVLDILKRPFPVRAYIIGNNGQGKSFLLAQLASELAQAGVASAGLSFGLTDRFHFYDDEQPRDQFTYLGARTTETSISMKATNERLERNIRIIRANSRRLKAFVSALRILGFGHSLYLVPRSLHLNGGTIPETALAKIEELTEADAKSEESLAAGAFSLGLIHKEPRHNLVLFEKLSSGEQQLITLAAKLAARAEKGMVMLLDEPELSLHVKWQRAVPLMLAELSKRLSCALVVATHSPVLIASTLDEDHCFSAANQILSPIAPHQRPSVESVLFDDFDTYTTNNRRVHELCAAMVAETISEVNGESGGGPDLQTLLTRLAELTGKVESGAMQQIAGRERDLVLIRRTKAAIEELCGQMKRDEAALADEN